MQRRLRWLFWFATVFFLLVGVGRAQAQIPGAKNLVETPKITIGNSKTTEDKVRKILGELEERADVLAAQAKEAEGWKRDLEEANQRIKPLQRKKEEFEQIGKEQPHLAKTLDANLNAALKQAEELAETLAFLVDTRTQEVFQVQEGMRHAHRLLRQLESPTLPFSPDDQLSLDEIVQYLNDLRLARISLSLLKARRAGLNEELEKTLDEVDDQRFELPPVDKSGDTVGALKVLLDMRQKMQETAPILNTFHSVLRKQVAAHIEAQVQRTRLQIYEKEEDLENRRQLREQVFASLYLSEDDLHEASQRLELAQEENSSKELEMRRTLKRLRLNPPEDDEGGVFTLYKQWQIQLTVLQHRLYLLDVEGQAVRLRAAAIGALFELTRADPPPEGFREDYKYYLDQERQEKARQELGKRRDAWRQEYTRVSGQDPRSGREKRAREILDSYQELLDLYDQIDALKWDMEYSAEVVRHYLELQEELQRPTSWYVWRGALSLFLVLVGLLLSYLLGRWTLRPIRKGNYIPGWKRLSLFLSYFFGLIALWTTLVVGTLAIVWGALFGFDKFSSVFSTVLFTIGEKEVTLYALGGLFGVIAMTMAVNRLVGRFLEKQIFPYFTWDIGVQHAFKAVFRYVILFGGIALGLEFVGIGLGALAVFAGVIGIGIGFGLQSIAANFISGMTLLFERPIKKGDFVDAGGLEGRVDEIRTRATRLVTRDKVSVIVPNSEFITARVVNWSHGSEDVRLHIPVGVAYGADVELVSKVLKEVGAAHPKVMKDPKPEVWFMEFGDSSLNFELLVWTQDIPRKYATISEINYAIDEAFRKHDIRIPFPQHDVHVIPPED